MFELACVDSNHSEGLRLLGGQQLLAMGTKHARCWAADVFLGDVGCSAAVPPRRRSAGSRLEVEIPASLARRLFVLTRRRRAKVICLASRELVVFVLSASS